jgi:hypothetical protein
VIRASSCGAWRTLFSPRATMPSIPHGDGRGNFGASTASPSNGRSNSLVVVRTSGMALEWMGAMNVVSIIIPVGVEQNLRRFTAPGWRPRSRTACTGTGKRGAIP